MKKITTFFLLCVFALAVNAVPARRGWQTRTQADGTTIEVQQLGDEFYHYFITKDGKVAELQDDGTFVVTNQQQPSADQVMALRKASRRYVNRAKKIGSGFMPARGLFILVSFSDKSFGSASESYYKTSLGDDTEGAKSMYNYLKLQSNGKYAPPIDVFGPVTLSKTVAYYGSNDSQGNDKHPAEMVVSACQALNAQVDFSQYDANGDGIVDNVYVIYAGKGEADGGAETTIWPHQWDIAGEGLSCVLDGKSIRSYACSSELSGEGIYAMGTPLHEFSHVLGLPDYYDTQYESTNYTEGRTPNEWSLMDGGSYNDNGKTPPNYSIFDKYYLGWDTPKLLAKNDQLNVTLTTEYGDAYQVNGGTTLLAATNTNTIYYVENRQQTGWDAALPGHGMIVWRVMYNESKWENNELNNYSGTTRYTVLSASGDQKNIGKASDPFPGTKNVKTWNPYNGCAFTEISETSGNITFKFNGGAPDVDPFDVTWMANGNVFTTTESTGTLVLPTGTPAACEGKVFVGWCSQANYSSETTAPTFAKAGDQVEEGAIFYAVFATQDGEGGATTWNLVSDASSLNAGDVLVMACTSKGATAGDISNQIMASVESTFSNNQITTLGTGSVELTLGGTTDAWTLSSTSGKLGATAVKKVAWGNGTTTWKITISNGDATIQNTNEDYGRFLYNATSPRFTTYTSNASASMLLPQLYRKTGGASYKDYTTKCESGTDIEQTQTKTTCRKFIKDGQLYILRGDAVYTVTGTRVQ